MDPQQQHHHYQQQQQQHMYNVPPQQQQYQQQPQQPPQQMLYQQQQPVMNHQQQPQQHHSYQQQQPNHAMYPQQQQSTVHYHYEQQPQGMVQAQQQPQQQQQYQQPQQQQHHYQQQHQQQPQMHHVIIQQPHAQQQQRHQPQVMHQQHQAVQQQHQRAQHPQQHPQQQTQVLRVQGGNTITLHRPPSNTAGGAAGHQTATLNGQVVRVVRLSAAARPGQQHQRPQGTRGQAPQHMRHQRPQGYVQQVRLPQQQQQQVWRQPQQQRPPQFVQQQHRVVYQQQQQQQQHHVVQQQQQQRPQQPTGAGGEKILYNVEHIFEENGKRVKKMPILVNGNTMWVDTVTRQEVDDSLSIPLDGDLEMPQQQQDSFEPPQQSVVPTTSGAGVRSNAAAAPVGSAPPKKSKNDFTAQEREAAIQRVVKDEVSPGVVAEELGLDVTAVRKWVRDAGLTLPKQYKVRKTDKKTTPATAAQVVMPSPGPPQVIVQQPRFPGLPPGARPAAPQQQQLRLPRPPTPAGTTPGFPRPPLPPTMPGQQVGQQQQQQVKTDAKKKPAAAASVAAAEPYKPKLIPGFLVLCKNCGTMGADFRRCESCKKAIPTDAKKHADKNSTLHLLQQQGGHSRVLESSTSLTVTSGAASAGELRTVRINKSRPGKKKPEEPECIAISSDEDEGEDGEGQEKAAEATTAKSEESDGKGNNSEDKGSNGGDDADLARDAVPDSFIEDAQHRGQFHVVQTRSIRLGSYKVIFKESALFTTTGIQLKVPDRFRAAEPAAGSGNSGEGNNAQQAAAASVKVNIKKADILKMQVHFGKTIPIVFLYLSHGACQLIRRQLKMDKQLGLWLDINTQDETMRRVTILPEKVPEEGKTILKSLFSDVIHELDSKTANDILVKSSPKETVATKMAQVRQQQQQGGQQQQKVAQALAAMPNPSTRLCQFPPSGSNTIYVTHEDYGCLEEDNFLNDNIIEFYFRWLQSEVMSEADRARTHFFTTFFYNKLTKRPPRLKNRLHQVEDNQNLTPAEKRFERVRRWTKKVNIFEKDFIVVPINEHSHWFLAVICYPGLRGCRRMSDDSPVDQPARQKAHAERRKARSAKGKKTGDGKRVVQIGSTSIIPLKGRLPGGGMAGDDGRIRLDEDLFDSDRDEADASDNEMMLEEPGDSSKRTSPNETPKKERSPEPPPKKNEETKKEEEEKPGTEEAKKEGNETGMDMEVEEESEAEEIKDTKKQEEADKKESAEDEDEEPMKDGELKLESSDEDTNVAEADMEGGDDKKKEEVEPKKEEDGEAEKPRQEDGKDEETKAGGKQEGQVNDAQAAKKEANAGSDAIKQPCILIFDSLTTGSHARVAATLREYLTCEYKARMSGEPPHVFTAENMRGNCPKVPQQPNFSDCGLYLLQYAESFFETPVTDFTLPLTNLKKWFPRAQMREKRDKIAAIIRKLSLAQNPNKNIVFPNVIFSADSGTGYSDEEEDGDEADSKKVFKTAEGQKLTIKTISLNTKGPGAAGTIAAVEKATAGSTASPAKGAAAAPQKLVVPSIIKVKVETPKKESAVTQQEKQAESVVTPANTKSTSPSEGEQKKATPAKTATVLSSAAAPAGGMLIVKKKGNIYLGDNRAAKAMPVSSTPDTPSTSAPAPAAPSQTETSTTAQQQATKDVEQKQPEAAGSSQDSSEQKPAEPKSTVISKPAEKDKPEEKAAPKQGQEQQKPVSNGVTEEETHSLKGCDGGDKMEDNAPEASARAMIDAAFGRRYSTEVTVKSVTDDGEAGPSSAKKPKLAEDEKDLDGGGAGGDAQVSSTTTTM